MRLWSIHPQYLDSKGLLALWREGLLAQKVLQGKTVGYRHHPQLERFQKSEDPLKMISLYLHHVCDESQRRNWRFQRSKIILGKPRFVKHLTVARGQLQFEWEHLLEKIKARDPQRFKELWGLKAVKTHPLFRRTIGGIAAWERV